MPEAKSSFLEDMASRAEPRFFSQKLEPKPHRTKPSFSLDSTLLNAYFWNSETMFTDLNNVQHCQLSNDTCQDIVVGGFFHDVQLQKDGIVSTKSAFAQFLLMWGSLSHTTHHRNCKIWHHFCQVNPRALEAYTKDFSISWIFEF